MVNVFIYLISSLVICCSVVGCWYPSLAVERPRLECSGAFVFIEKQKIKVYHIVKFSGGAICSTGLVVR